MASRLLAGLLSGAMLVAIAQAQSISVPSTLHSGDEVNLSYSDPSRGGQTIVIRVCVYNPDAQIVELQVHLDKSGRGSVAWTVPEGMAVTFNAPGIREVNRVL